MKNDLSAEQLAQPVTVTLPLGAVLRLAEPAPGIEVKARLHDLTANRPAIGGKGLQGAYAGIARGYNGEPDAILEVLAEAPQKMSWQDAMKWAESTGGRLPTRKEQALLFANVPELFEKDWYWSCEPYAGDEGYAWFQTFYSGYQYFYRKDSTLRARAVRRFPIE